MAKRKKMKFATKILVVLIPTIIILITLFFGNKGMGINTFTSEMNGIRFNTPDYYLVEENEREVILTNNSDLITIRRDGILNKNFDDFILDIEKYNDNRINILSNKEKNGMTIYEVEIEDSSNSKGLKKEYYLNTDEWRYNVSSNSDRLAADMRLIVNSLEYIGPDGDFTHKYITPTTFPADRVGWLSYKHPKGYYNFSFPADWHLNVYQNRRDSDIYDITLNPENSNPNDSKRIHFMTGGRGGPYYEYETNEEKVINGRTINWNIMYMDNKAFEAVVSFPNNDFGNNLIGLYIYLPKDNQQEFIKQVEEIIASLK